MLRDYFLWFVVIMFLDFDDDIGINNFIFDNVILLNFIEKEFEFVVNVKVYMYYSLKWLLLRYIIFYVLGLLN